MKEKLRAISFCSGIGFQERGGENTECFDFESVGTSEIDIYAIISFAAIHHGLTEEMVDSYENYPSLDEMRKWLIKKNIGYIPEKKKKYDWNKNGKTFERQIRKTWLACYLNKNMGDVSLIEELPDADVWFCSFPCQSISIAGKLRGMSPDDETRSSLVWHTVRLLEWAKQNEKLPKYMILENVKNLVGKQFKSDFDNLNLLISEYGYNVYYEVINSKNTGVPQNRERVFAVYVRKDIDNGKFTFPKPFDNGIRMKDILEDEVDDKYYIRNERAKYLIEKLIATDDSGAVDLTLNEPKRRDVANCLMGYRGIHGKAKARDNGVLVKK